jgi:hypothetical protein
MAKAKPALNGAAQIGAHMLECGETGMAFMPLEQQKRDGIWLLPSEWRLECSRPNIGSLPWQN